MICCFTDPPAGDCFWGHSALQLSSPGGTRATPEPWLCSPRWPGSQDLTSAVPLLLPSVFDSLADLVELLLLASPVYPQGSRSRHLLQVIFFLLRACPVCLNSYVTHSRATKEVHKHCTKRRIFEIPLGTTWFKYCINEFFQTF